MSVTRVKQRHRRTAARLDIAIAAVGAFGAGVLAGIRFYGNDEPGFGFLTPDGIHQIARILRAKFEAELATDFAGAERGFRCGGTEINEIQCDGLRGEAVHVGAHLWHVHRKRGVCCKALAGRFFERALRDAQSRAWNLAEAGRVAAGEQDSRQTYDEGWGHEKTPSHPSVAHARFETALTGSRFARGRNDTLEAHVVGLGAVAFIVVACVTGERG